MLDVYLFVRRLRVFGQEHCNVDFSEILVALQELNDGLLTDFLELF